VRRFNILVFNEFQYGTTNTYSSDVRAALLGAFDHLSLFVVADQVGGPAPTLTIQIEVSSDGRNWASNQPTAEINGVALTAAVTNVISAAATGLVRAHAALLRLRIALSSVGAPPSAQLKIYVCGRDKAKAGGGIQSARLLPQFATSNTGILPSTVAADTSADATFSTDKTSDSVCHCTSSTEGEGEGEGAMMGKRCLSNGGVGVFTQLNGTRAVIPILAKVVTAGCCKTERAATVTTTASTIEKVPYETRFTSSIPR